jgi:hypothetical protein
MADILLSNDDLTVFGGPESVSLDLDIGPQGDRGSIIVGSNGHPQDANVHADIMNIPEGIQALDIAIDYNPFSSTYKTVFQRIATATGTQWTELFSLKTNFYSDTQTLTAANGKLVLSPINVTQIYGGVEATSENLSIQYSISSGSGGPMATKLVIKDLNTTQGFLALPLEIEGVEYVDGSWGPLVGPKTVHLFITVV